MNTLRDTIEVLLPLVLLAAVGVGAATATPRPAPSADTALRVGDADFEQRAVERYRQLARDAAASARAASAPAAAK